MAKTSSRVFKITCIGDSEVVADMLEDIAKHVREGWIHHKEDSFYELESYGYVKEEHRRK